MSKQKTIGEQIGEAVQDAITGQDFSKLQETVKRSIGFAAQSINDGLAQAAREAQQTRENHEREQAEREARRKAQLVVSSRYASTSGLKISGYLMAIGGGALAIALALAAVVTSVGAFIGAPLFGGLTTTLLVFAAGSTALAIFGGTRIGLAGRFATYQRIIGTSDWCTIDDLAHRSGKSPKRVLKDLRKMTERGMFTQGHLDEESGIFFACNEAHQLYERKRAEELEQRRQERLVRQREASTITPEARAILDKGDAYLAQIRQRNEDIPGEEVSAKITQIELIIDSIFKRAKEHPEVIDDLQQLMDYYLPVTVKLLDAYADLDGQPVQSDSILQSKREIEDTLDTLNTAFANLLDSIFKDMTWDVSTDISVLHTVLAQEGLTDNPFENKHGGQ